MDCMDRVKCVPVSLQALYPNRKVIVALQNYESGGCYPSFRKPCGGNLASNYSSHFAKERNLISTLLRTQMLSWSSCPSSWRKYLPQEIDHEPGPRFLSHFVLGCLVRFELFLTFPSGRGWSLPVINPIIYSDHLFLEHFLPGLVRCYCFGVVRKFP